MVDKQTKQIPPINWNGAIVDASGKPTKGFIQAWNRITAAANSIPDLPTDAAGVSALLDLIGGTEGDLLRRGAMEWETLGNDTADPTKYLSEDGTYTVPAGGGGGALDPFMFPPPLRPDQSVTYNPGFFAALPVIPCDALTVTGLRVGVNTAAASKTIQAALYAGNALTGAALVAASAPVTLVTGIMSIPFATPVVLTPLQIYWAGLNILPTGGTSQFMSLDGVRNGFFFAQASTSFPGTAPAASASGAGANFSWWLY